MGKIEKRRWIVGPDTVRVNNYQAKDRDKRRSGWQQRPPKKANHWVWFAESRKKGNQQRHPSNENIKRGKHPTIDKPRGAQRHVDKTRILSSDQLEGRERARVEDENLADNNRRASKKSSLGHRHWSHLRRSICSAKQKWQPSDEPIG